MKYWTMGQWQQELHKQEQSIAIELVVTRLDSLRLNQAKMAHE